MIYKTIKRHNVRSIVEFGVADGQRSEKLIRVAQKFTDEPILYTGIDLFESRNEDQPQVSLIEMHKRLKKTGAKIKLVPGDPESSTARVANSLCGTDLILLTLETELADLDRFWFFFPRMVHDETMMLVQSGKDSGERFRVMQKKDWSRWTEQTGNSRVSKAA